MSQNIVQILGQPSLQVPIIANQYSLLGSQKGPIAIEKTKWLQISGIDQTF